MKDGSVEVERCEFIPKKLITTSMVAHRARLGG